MAAVTVAFLVFTAALTTEEVVAEKTLPTFESARNFQRPPPFSSDSEFGIQISFKEIKIQTMRQNELRSRFCNTFL